MPETVAQKRRAFRRLHESGCFVIPNPWDPGSARWLEGMGFRALATTSSGHAWSRGKPDGSQSRDEVLAHLREMVEATNLPVNADFENGFGEAPDDVATSVRLAVATGIAGLSIEDSTGDASRPLFGIDEGVARIRAARRAIDEAGGEVMLVGRCECFWVGRPDLDETVSRLKAYSEAGADCLYAPAIKTRAQIEAIVRAVAPKPVNLLIGGTSEFTMAQVEALGVRRVSLGGALARAAWGGFLRAASLLRDEGRFDGFAGAVPGADLNGYFAGLRGKKDGP